MTLKKHLFSVTKMKNIYFIAFIIILFIASFSLPFGVNKSNAQQCNDSADNDTDGDTDFPDDLQCTSLIDDDESVLGGDTYISFQDPAGTPVYVTRCGGVLVLIPCSNYDNDAIPSCPTGWSCPVNNTGATCHVGVSGTTSVACGSWVSSCTTPYEACNCTCPAVIPPGSGCACPARRRNR